MIAPSISELSATMHQQAKLRRTMGLVVIWMSAPSVAVDGDLQERQDLISPPQLTQVYTWHDMLRQRHHCGS